MRCILVPGSQFHCETSQVDAVSLLYEEEGGRWESPRCFFYVPESNYPPFCGASSEITDLTVTKYCHPGKPFCNQQGGFFLLSSRWKGPLFSGRTPGECYLQRPLGAGTLGSRGRTWWHWHWCWWRHLGAAGTQNPSRMGHCMGNFWLCLPWGLGKLAWSGFSLFSNAKMNSFRPNGLWPSLRRWHLCREWKKTLGCYSAFLEELVMWVVVGWPRALGFWAHILELQREEIRVKLLAGSVLIYQQLPQHRGFLSMGTTWMQTSTV